MRDVDLNEKDRKRMSELRRACTRNGIVCGHRRAVSAGSGGTSGGTICYFMLDTGCQRRCPAGKQCIHYTPTPNRMKRLGVYEDYI